jgi:diguanylate cyclase (GGDEF)-like protein/PAS domain S-box-containing protein
MPTSHRRKVQHRATRSRPGRASRARFGLVLVSAVVIAAGTAQTIAALRGGADESRQAQTVVARLEGQIHRQTAIRWQAVGSGALDGELTGSLRATNEEVASLLETIDRIERASFGLRALTLAAIAYQASLEEQLAVIDDDPLRAAELERSSVAPALEGFVRARGAATTALDEGARSSGMAADLGTLTSLMSAAILTSLLFRKWERARRRHAFVDGEQTGVRLSEARFRSFVQHSSDLISVIDADGRVAYVSPSVERLLGAGPSIVGRSLVELVHPDDRGTVAGLLGDAAREAGPRTVEWRLQHASGEWRTFEHHASHGQGSMSGRLIVNSRDVTERRRLEDALRHQADHDPLTGLANRTLAADVLRRALARGRRHGGSIGLLLLDLDDFKAVNDSLGHAAGDDLLQAIGQRLRAAVRSESLIARIGGDEFAVVVEDLDRPERAADVARRIQTALHRPIAIAGREFVVSASIGIATATSGEPSVEMLLRQADIAMYASKRHGRGSFAMFDASMHEAAFARLQQEQDLRAAVASEEFVTQYQPIHDLSSGAIVGYEALVRWAHPDRGLLGPGEFLPLAESTGLIVEIGRAVLRTATRQLAAWDAEEGSDVQRWMSVNLSPRQLLDGAVLTDVADALRTNGLAPDRLILELTEGSVMDDPDVAAGLLSSLKDIGVGLAIDDFGTGYSSLGHLQRFPFDLLKIDRSFIKDLAEDRVAATLAPAIVDLARRLGLKTVAEGIETIEQLENLRSLGCELGQGFLFNRPLDPTAAGGALAWTAPTPTPGPGGARRRRLAAIG